MLTSPNARRIAALAIAAVASPLTPAQTATTDLSLAQATQVSERLLDALRQRQAAV